MGYLSFPRSSGQVGCGIGVHGMAGEAALAADHAVDLVELCGQTGTPMPLEIAAPAAAALIVSGCVDLAGRIQDLAEVAVVDSDEAWAPALTASMRSLVAVYSGDPATAKEAIDEALRLEPPDYCVTLKAFSRWLAALSSDRPRAEVAAQMEHVLELAGQVRSTLLNPLYGSFLASIRAEIGELPQAMAQAADNLEDALGTQTLATITGGVRRAAVMLIEAGSCDTAARLLGWVDNQDSNPVAHELAVRMDEALPRMRAVLGDETADAAARAGAEMTMDDAVALAVHTLRAAASSPVS